MSSLRTSRYGLGRIQTFLLEDFNTAALENIKEILRNDLDFDVGQGALAQIILELNSA
jgi:hypothetical protein